MAADQRIQTGLKPGMVLRGDLAVEPVFFKLEKLIFKRVQHSIRRRSGGFCTVGRCATRSLWLCGTPGRACCALRPVSARSSPEPEAAAKNNHDHPGNRKPNCVAVGGGGR